MDILDFAVTSTRFLVAVVFLTAGLAKLRQPNEFENAISNYDIIPRRFSRHVAIWLPRAEVVCGLLLGLGLGIPIVSLALGSLLVGFSLAVGWNLLRGRSFDCGCFGVATPKRITWLTVTRNLLLACAAVLTVIHPPLALSIDGVLNQGRSAAAISDGMAVLAFSVIGVLISLVVVEGRRVRRATRLLQPGGPR